MRKLIQTLLDTSEVWALLIPLIFLLFNKIDRKPVKEVIIYLWVALLLNTAIVIVSFLPYYKNPDNYPFLLVNNNVEYNIHSIVRVVLFTLFFIRNSSKRLHWQKKVLMALFLIFAAVNFTFFESPVDLLSSRLFTVEAIVLLFFCIYYYLNSIMEERNVKLYKNPVFWVITGLSIYEAVNFFIFLLFTYLVKNYTVFATHIWNFHNISFVILCLFITKAFYESRRK